MRATIGRIALVSVVCITLCGCQGGTNIFAKKKSSDSEAPKFAGNPTLPSSGQAPGTPPTNVDGTVAASTPAYNSVDNKFANSSYGTQPAAYQQSVYPTTPYPPVSLGQNPAGTGAANPAAGVASSAPGAPASSPASGGLVDHRGATPAYGAANPTISYGNNASTTVQPQQGPYNPSYGGSGTSAPQSYAAVPPSSPTGNSPSPMVSAPGAMPSVAAPPDYRTADARGANSYMAQNAAAQNSATQNPTAQNSAAPPEGNSILGDRYSHLNDGNNSTNSNNTTWPDNRYPNPAHSPTGNGAEANPHPPAAGDRYSLPPSATSQGAPSGPPASSPYVNPAEIAPSAPGNSLPAVPARPDPNYRPAKTSSLPPRGDSLRPADSPQSEPPRVMPASFETAMNSTMAPVTPAGGSAAQTSPNANSTETYGDYQGAPAQPAQATPAQQSTERSSNTTPAQPGLFHGHSW